MHEHIELTGNEVSDGILKDLGYGGPPLPRFLVTATRVSTMVIEAVDLKEAEAMARRACKNDDRRLVSIEPYTETEATALDGH